MITATVVIYSEIKLLWAAQALLKIGNCHECWFTASTRLNAW
jgi:hypothetical protein